jgi:Geranylgeranyl pyrophosphate synthase
MSREDTIAYLGPDWDRVQDLIRSRLQTDVLLLGQTNDWILSNSGKMLRPVVALLVAKAIASPTEDSRCYAAAAELLHNATLIHDDVADESAERRGRPTLNALLGPGPAVLVGDFWLARAVDLVVRTDHRDRTIPILAKTLTDLAEGEMLQLEKAASGDTTEQDYLRIIHCKTASLFQSAAETAALSVDASPGLVEAAKAYGSALGAAFQIKDDILDYVGTDALGKPIGVDLKEQKITLPLLAALEGSPREAEIRQLVREIPEHPDHCGRILAFVAERNGVGLAARKLDEWVERAVRALDAFPDGKARRALVEIARYNQWREV